jgi:beta-alanine degradation protein BauB
MDIERNLNMKSGRPGVPTLIACILLGLGSGAAWNQESGGSHAQPPHGAREAAQIGPANAKVELDNESLLVLRIHLGPHEKTPMHEVSPRLVVWITDAHLKDTFQDGTSQELRRIAGTAEWVPAQRHSGENLSDLPIQFLAIVPKAK